jgi:acyl carrier protein
MLAERVTTVIANFTQIPPERITPDMTFPELGLDSLQALNLLYELENEFQVAIPNARALQIRCVRDVLEVMGDLQPDEGGATQQADLPTGLPAAGGD